MKIKPIIFLLFVMGFVACRPEKTPVSENYIDFNESLEIALNNRLLSRKAYLDWVVKYTDNSQAEKTAIKRLLELDHQVLELLKELENLKFQLQQLPSHDKSFVKETFIKNQKGIYLEDKLNGFVDLLYQNFKDVGIKKSENEVLFIGDGYITDLAKGNQNDPVFQGLPSASKGFVEVHFRQYYCY